MTDDNDAKARRGVRNALNIATLSDHRYLQQLSVMLLSLRESNKHQSVTVFVIVTKDVNRSALDTFLGHIETATLKIVLLEIDEKQVETVPRRKGHGYHIAYSKLLIAELIPEDIHRVIYLDPDILVLGDLKELWDVELGECLVGAVQDHSDPEDQRKINAKLDLLPDAPYFNSGVMLINLDRWRNSKVGYNSVRFALQHAERILHNDQDPLNRVLRGRWKALPSQWNLQTTAVTRIRWGFMDYTKEAAAIAAAAKIIHFTGSSKPWHYMNNHPMKNIYINYVLQTPWKDVEYSDYSIKNAIRKAMYKFTPFLLRIYYISKGLN
jgi:lipopolysaccharide biosynthesis glycosyltransferase